MKIAIFYNLNFGGAKRVVMEHAKGLKKKGYQIDLYTVNHEKDIFDPSRFCDNVYNYSFTLDAKYSMLKRFVNDYRNFFTLKKLHKKIANDIDNRCYDIALVHPDSLTQSPFILRFLQTPSVYYCQEPLRIVYEYSMRLKERVGFLKRSYEELTRLYRRKIDRKNVRCASFTIASCYYVRERMIEVYDVYPKVVYCAVDEKVFIPTYGKDKRQVLYIGSPDVWEDGYDLVISAMRLIPKRIRPDLSMISWSNDNKKRLTEDELIKNYNKSFVTLCVSRLEPFGLIPLESMSCGVPVIATRVGGHRETVIEGKTGFLVDFEPGEIAERIMQFIDKPSLSEFMGKEGRKWIEKEWTWEKQIKQLEILLKEFSMHKP